VYGSWEPGMFHAPPSWRSLIPRKDDRAAPKGPQAIKSDRSYRK
jgi:hypothetical protein